MTDPNDDAENIDITARTCFGEARGEQKIGMQAVANVIQTRSNIASAYMLTKGKPHPLFGDGSAASACKMPWQFSCWNAADPNSQIINDVDDSIPVFRDAVWIATGVLNGTLGDVTNKATHYYDRRMVNPPGWAVGKQPCATIGHHLFYNNI